MPEIIRPGIVPEHIKEASAPIFFQGVCPICRAVLKFEKAEGTVIPNFQWSDAEEKVDCLIPSEPCPCCLQHGGVYQRID